MTRAFFAIIVALALVDCGGSTLRPAAALTEPTELCVRDVRGPCRSSQEIEGWLTSPDLQVLGVANTTTGRQNAKVLTLAVPSARGRIVFRAKWRAQSTAHRLNDPRREIAAYAVQKLYLDPEDYVVPPAAMHCFPLGQYRKIVEPNATPRGELRCEYGTLEYWLENALDLKTAEDEGWFSSYELFDARLFRTEEIYRRSLANMNLFLYLIDHGDSHKKQFVFTRVRRSLHAWDVDNSIAFSLYRNPRLTPQLDWSILHVPAVPKNSIERLRKLSLDDVRELLVIEQLELQNGMLVRGVRSTPAMQLDYGLRWAGNTLQVGLTESEVNRLWNRIRSAVRRVDAGELRSF